MFRVMRPALALLILAPLTLIPLAGPTTITGLPVIC